MIYELKKDTLEFNKGDRFAKVNRSGIEYLVLINGQGEIRLTGLTEIKLGKFFTIIHDATPSARYEPEVGSDYFFIGSAGAVTSTTHGQTVADQSRIDLGNAYEDEASALKAVAWLKARATILKDARVIKIAAEDLSAHAIGYRPETNELIAFEYNLEANEYVPPVAFYATTEAVEAVLADRDLYAAYQTYYTGV